MSCNDFCSDDCDCGESLAYSAHTRWDEGPCYICSAYVPPHLGWHREDFDGVSRHWCDNHQPVWSRNSMGVCGLHGEYEAAGIFPTCPTCSAVARRGRIEQSR